MGVIFRILVPNCQRYALASRVRLTKWFFRFCHSGSLVNVLPWFIILLTDPASRWFFQFQPGRLVWGQTLAQHGRQFSRLGQRRIWWNSTWSQNPKGLPPAPSAISTMVLRCYHSRPPCHLGQLKMYFAQTDRLDHGNIVFFLQKFFWSLKGKDSVKKPKNEKSVSAADFVWKFKVALSQKHPSAPLQTCQRWLLVRRQRLWYRRCCLKTNQI